MGPDRTIAVASAPAADGPLQTVARAMDVLLSFSESRTDWGVYELAADFGWTKSTAQRLLAALASKGFLRADPCTRRYSLGPALWRLSVQWERSGGLARLTQDLLATLTRDTGLTSLFSVPDGVFVRCVAAEVGSGGPPRSRPLVGELYPAHAGATGRAYFAFLEPEQRRRMLSQTPLGRYSDLTEVESAKVEELFSAAAASGYAISFGEWDARTRALAVPVFALGRVVGSLTIVGLNEGDPAPELECHLPQVLAAATDLGERLSGTQPPARRDWRRRRADGRRPALSAGA